MNRTYARLLPDTAILPAAASRFMPGMVAFQLELGPG
jgi:hypothetical protein